MTEMTFEVVQGDYGEEIAVRFDYNETLVDRIRELREDHNWQKTHCTPNYSDDDEFLYWSIDRTEEAVDLFHEVVGYPIPEDVRPEPNPDETDVDTVELVVPEGDTRVHVRGAPDEVHSVLDATFSYDNPDAEHSHAAPPRIHIYDVGRRCAPMGLTDRAANAIETLGYDVEVRVEGDRSGRAIDTEWQFKHDLRGYQAKAVESVLDNGGGIVGLPTGSGKTVTALRLVDLIGQDAIVFVHTKELLHQWADEVQNALGVEPGVIGDGEWSIGPVTICTMQTLMSKGIHRLDDPGVLVFDECHRTSAADTMNEIGLSLDAEYRIGLSATPWRRVSGAEIKIEGAVGAVAHEVTAEQLIDDGFLAEPTFKTLEHDGPVPMSGEKYHEAYERCIEHSDERNDAIADEAVRLARAGYNVLVNVDRVDQGAQLSKAVTQHLGRPRSAEFLCGSDPTSRREDVLGEFENGDTDVLVSTLIKEGVDIPAIDAVILAHGGKSDISTLQVIGRALRTGGGRDHAVIVDVRDEGGFFYHAHAERQRTMKEYYGAYGPGGELSREPPADPEPTRSSLSEPMSDEEMAEMEDWLDGMAD